MAKAIDVRRERIIESAMERVRNGESMKIVAHETHIPFSTLRDRVMKASISTNGPGGFTHGTPSAMSNAFDFSWPLPNGGPLADRDGLSNQELLLALSNSVTGTKEQYDMIKSFDRIPPYLRKVTVYGTMDYRANLAPIGRTLHGR